MRFRYRTIEFGDIDIHLRTLRDTNEFSDPDGEAEALGISPSYWPLFGVVWTSSIALAAVMVETDIAGRRILEVGCGIGLASMVLNHRSADITATDRHPDAEAFLARNAKLNDAPPIPFERSDWQDEDDDLGRFDLIIGSDLLHDRSHTAPLARFIDNHAAPAADVVIVDPGRGQVSQFARDMTSRGFSYAKRRAVDDKTLHLGEEVGPKVQIHTFQRHPPS